MGRSDDGQTAFAEWSRWPQLLGATVKWLAPQSGEVTAPEPLKTKERDAAVQTLEDKRMDRMIDAGFDAKPAPKTAASAADQAKSHAAIRTLLANGAGDAPSAAVLADQLGADTSIAVPLAEEIIRFLAANRPPAPRLIESAKRCAASADPATASLGQQLLGMSGSPDFAKAVRELGDTGAPSLPQVRWGTMTGIALYPGNDLTALGVARCAAWQVLSDKRFNAYTDGKGYSAGFPPVPHLDSDSLLERAAWLGYLHRQKPDEFAGPLLHEWLLLAQYADYCDQTTGVYLERAGKGAPVQAGPLRVKAAQAQELKRYYLQLSALLAAQARDVFTKRPAVAADVIAKTFCRTEVQRAMNLIGSAAPADSKAVLEKLIAAKHPQLAAPAALRLSQ
jgi:hypothetical protein